MPESKWEVTKVISQVKIAENLSSVSSPLNPFGKGTLANNVDSDQTSQNAASDPDLQCL